jgi:hypothetical protein
MHVTARSPAWIHKGNVVADRMIQKWLCALKDANLAAGCGRMQQMCRYVAGSLNLPQLVEQQVQALKNCD